MAYIRDGVNHVSPYLIVRNANQLIQFLQDVFDAQLLLKMGSIQDQPLHSEVKIKDSVIMIGTSESDDLGINPSMLHVYVEDADSVFKKALDHGATMQMPIQSDEAAGDRRGMFLGPQGNYWAVAIVLS